MNSAQLVSDAFHPKTNTLDLNSTENKRKGQEFWLKKYETDLQWSIIQYQTLKKKLYDGHN